MACGSCLDFALAFGGIAPDAMLPRIQITEKQIVNSVVNLYPGQLSFLQHSCRYVILKILAGMLFLKYLMLVMRSAKQA